MTVEQQAIKLGDNPKLLLNRLKRARAALYPEFGQKFKDAKFDYEHKQLVSSCGKYALVWELRRWPNRSIDYMNQQTSTGNVVIRVLTE